MARPRDRKVARPFVVKGNRHMTTNDKLVRDIRQRFAHLRLVSDASEADILGAYAIWHVLGGQDWRRYPILINRDIRRGAWYRHAAAMGRQSESHKPDSL